MELLGTLLGIVLGLGAVVAWLLTAGRTLQRNEETVKDVDALGNKIEYVRKDLQSQINENKNEHDSLAREVSEIKSTTTSTLALVEQLVRMHLEEKKG